MLALPRISSATLNARKANYAPKRMLSVFSSYHWETPDEFLRRMAVHSLAIPARLRYCSSLTATALSTICSTCASSLTSHLRALLCDRRRPTSGLRPSPSPP